MRAVGAIEKEDGDQKKRGEAEQREDERRVLEALVVHLHGDDHGGQSGDRPDQLLEQEFVGGAEALFGHDGGGAEDHDQADEDEDAW